MCKCFINDLITVKQTATSLLSLRLFACFLSDLSCPKIPQSKGTFVFYALFSCVWLFLAHWSLASYKYSEDDTVHRASRSFCLDTACLKKAEVFVQKTF